MRETDRQMKETDRLSKETKQQQKETDRQMQETDRRMDKRMKELESLFTGQWGKLMESLVEGDLVDLLQAKGINVRSTHTRVKGRRNGEHYEYDILAVNSEVVVVVEVKTTMRAPDVTDFLEKLARFTQHEPVFRGKQVYGALARISHQFACFHRIYFCCQLVMVTYPRWCRYRLRLMRPRLSFSRQRARASSTV